MNEQIKYNKMQKLQLKKQVWLVIVKFSKTVQTFNVFWLFNIW